MCFNRSSRPLSHHPFFPWLFLFSHHQTFGHCFHLPPSTQSLLHCPLSPPSMFPSNLMVTDTHPRAAHSSPHCLSLTLSIFEARWTPPCFSIVLSQTSPLASFTPPLLRYRFLTSHFLKQMISFHMFFLASRNVRYVGERFRKSHCTLARY